MELDNKTFVILGVIAMGVLAIFFKNNNLALAIGSGLVGYLSKDAEIHINKFGTQGEEDFNDIDGDYDNEI